MTPFAEAFLALRMRHKLSQSRFAELISCDHSFISRIETGQRLPSREFIERMGVDFDMPQSDVDMLLAAAGFLPSHFVPYAYDPDVIVALDALHDPTVPDAIRDVIRQGLHIAGDAARLAKGPEAA